MKTRSIISILSVLMLISMASCTKSSLQSAYNSQEQKIDTYINSLIQKDTTIRLVNNKGSHRVVLVEGEGEELTNTGSVAIYYAGYTFSSGISASSLFATNHQETAEQSKLNIDDPDYNVLTLNMKDAELFDGLKNGLIGVKSGEECMILFSGKYGAGKRGLGTIPANSALAYHIWVAGVNND